MQAGRESPLFQSQSEAKAFLVDKIVAQARVEGQPLCDHERWMLRFSESDPDFVIDLARVEQLKAEISDTAYEDRVVGLLQRSMQRDVESNSSAPGVYRAASATLHQGDHYLSIMIDRALEPGTRGSRVVHGIPGFVLFGMLLMPGTIAVLLAVGMVVGPLLTGERQSADDKSRVVMVSLVLGGIGYYLIHLWRRERRARRLT
jgi:hypothetical protein